MRFLKVGAWALVSLSVLATAVALIGQNTENLTVTLFSYTSGPLPKWALLIGSLLLGAFLASLFFIIELVILETKNIRFRRQIKLMDRAIKELESKTGMSVSSSGELLSESSNSDRKEPSGLSSPSGSSKNTQVDDDLSDV